MLQSMAGAPNLIDALKQGNPAAALANVYDHIEVRSMVTPPVHVNVLEALDSSQPTSPLVKFLKPTVIFSGPYGRTVVAPYGESGDGTLMTVLAIVGLVGLGVLIGRLSK